jgi:hypothetical protein
MTDDWEGIWMEAVVAFLKTLPRHVTTGTDADTQYISRTEIRSVAA